MKTRILVLLSMLAGFAPAAAVAQDVLIRGAKVYTVSAGTLPNTDVLVRRGIVTAVGNALAAPDGATVVEAKGRALTPGLFGGLSAVGLEEVEQEEGTADENLVIRAPFHEMQLRPEFDPTASFNPRSTLVPVTRVEGVTWTVLAPGAPSNGGSFIQGPGAAVTLDGRYDAVLAGSRALFVNLGTDAFAVSGGSRAAQFMVLEEAVREARDRGLAIELSVLHPAGRDVLKRYLANGRVVFDVDRAADIRQVLAFSKRHGMKPIIASGAEAWVVAAELAREKVPVLLDALLDLPSDFDHIGARLDNAALLDKAGVKIAFSQYDRASANARKVRQLAGNAVAHGLAFDAALAALTSNPADIFGLGATRGRIARGQVADLVLWSGEDPLEVSSLADQVWIAGIAIEMRSRQSDLRDRYLERLRQNQAR
ncbi:MAG: amidohydrolase family protein [Steroidobacteraceae bacterium]